MVVNSLVVSACFSLVAGRGYCVWGIHFFSRRMGRGIEFDYIMNDWWCTAANAAALCKGKWNSAQLNPIYTMWEWTWTQYKIKIIKIRNKKLLENVSHLKYDWTKYMNKRHSFLCNSFLSFWKNIKKCMKKEISWKDSITRTRRTASAQDVM